MIICALVARLSWPYGTTREMLLNAKERVSLHDVERMHRHRTSPVLARADVPSGGQVRRHRSPKPSAKSVHASAERTPGERRCANSSGRRRRCAVSHSPPARGSTRSAHASPPANVQVTLEDVRGPEVSINSPQNSRLDSRLKSVSRAS